MPVESFVVDLIEGKRRSNTLLSIFKFLSLLYRMLVCVRNFAYDWNLLKTDQAPKYVISIGNIVAGGSGKTPLVRLLAEQLSGEKKVAILSRGYRSAIEKSGKVIEISKSKLPSIVCGDEPQFLSSKLPGTAVWVGKNRKISAKEASNDADILILDDGMQYRSLHRDLEIVAMDAADPFGKGEFLPRGFLRDSPKRLKTASLIALTYVKNERQFQELKDRIKDFSGAPVCGFCLNIENKEALKDKKVGIFSAIAKPNRFFETVDQLGAKIVSQWTLDDHGQIQGDQLEAFAAKCATNGAEFLLCTEKDWVKLPLESKICLPILPLKTTLEIVFGIENWYALLNLINKESR